MNQVVKDKMQREILVVANTQLFENISRATKVYSSEADFESIILKSYEYMIRWDAEVNFAYKQPIPYAIVLNEHNEVFVYKRGGAGSNAGESRLHEKIAIWVWGHIEREDEDSKNILRDSLVREIEEELNIIPENIIETFPIWYINSEEDEVSKVHLGIAYIAKVKNSHFELLDGELDNWEFVSYESLMDMCKSGNYDVEAWTQLIAPEIQKYI